MSTMQSCVLATKALAVEALAQELCACIRDVVQARGECSIALSGGSTPQALYERLAKPDLAARIPWSALRVYWGDERCVGGDDRESNQRMARQALLDHVPIDPSHVHPIQGQLEPAQAAALYAAALPTAALDIVLLGVGGDGHIASLFPGGGELNADASVAPSLSPIEPSQRVTLTLKTINRARHVFFLVCGGEKRQRLLEIQAELKLPVTQAGLPAARVRPSSGTALWFGDQAALGHLASPTNIHE